jgi:hypothetical protein
MGGGGTGAVGGIKGWVIVVEGPMNPRLLDPVIDEIREIRHRISERFGHNTSRLVAYYMDYQEHYRDRLVTATGRVEQEDQRPFCREGRSEKLHRRKMDAALAYIEDTLRLLLEEAKQAKQIADPKRGSPEEAFEIGRSEALAEALHTWANQVQTFGLEAQLNETWKEVRAFLASRGY